MVTITWKKPGKLDRADPRLDQILPFPKRVVETSRVIVRSHLPIPDPIAMPTERGFLEHARLLWADIVVGKLGDIQDSVEVTGLCKGIWS